ncbi:hypothetical protein L249_5221, partial [Ophiocordyceps polyrhachis-furcata BCC 54312]
EMERTDEDIQPLLGLRHNLQLISKVGILLPTYGMPSITGRNTNIDISYLLHTHLHTSSTTFAMQTML